MEENVREKVIRQQIIIDLIIDKLYDCLEVEGGKIHFEKYDMSSNEVLYLLSHYDKEKYDAYCDLLLNKNKKGGDE